MMTMTIEEKQGNTAGSGCYTITDLMEILGVGRKSVMVLLKQKLFPWIMIAGKYYRIPKTPFDCWLNGIQ